MINKIIGYFKDLDKNTYKIMKYGLYFCLAIAIISALILLIYSATLFNANLYYIGISIFKLSLSFSVDFIICGLVMDSISKQLV